MSDQGPEVPEASVEADPQGEPQNEGGKNEAQAENEAQADPSGGNPENVEVPAQEDAVADPPAPAEDSEQTAAPAETEATEASEDAGGEQEPAGSKPASPKGSKPASAQGSQAGSKPASPKPGTPPVDTDAAEKPASPVGSQKGSKPPTPQPAEEGEAEHTSKPGTPAPEGSKPASAAGSKPASVAGSKPASAAGSKPPSVVGSKPGSPTGSKAGSKPPSVAGSKPPTPTGTPTGDPEKPASPAGSQQGSRPPSVAGSKQGSKPGTPTGEPAKPASPAGSKPGSKQASRTGTPAGSKQASKAGSPAGSKQGSRAGTPAQKPDTPPVDAGIPTPPPIPGAQTASGTATPEEKLAFSTLSMQWSFGLNKNVPVLNLSDEKRNAVMYACAHTGVVYDHGNNKQMLLQGHSNAISCSCVSEDKRWLATADTGNNSLIIVWDTLTGTPVRTIFEAHPQVGVVAMTMTPDAKFLATLSGGEAQILSIWDWTAEAETPICSTQLDPRYGQQTYICFNVEDVTQVVTNSESQVIFYSWRSNQLEHCAPPLTDDDFNKHVGRFSQSIFLHGSTRALTATSLGNLVEWDVTKTAYNNPMEKKAMKLVRLQERGLNVLSNTNGYIVTGDSIGHVKFFDDTLKLVNWYQDFHLGPINALGFAYMPDFAEEARPGSSYPPDATIAARQFALRDFTVGTTTAVYAHVVTDGTQVRVILRDHDAAVHALAAHPSEPRFYVGSYSGLLKVWDYEKKCVVASRSFKQGQMIRCCTIDPKAEYLAVGFTNGVVRILDAISLSDVCESFHYARDTITHLAFAHNSRYLASADADYAVSVFKITTDSSEEPWIYLGRYRAHYKLVQSVTFGVQLDSDEPRLMSLGKDRVLVEYDLENSGKDDLRILSMDRIEQSAVPLCMEWYPAVTKESFLLTANNQYKFKLYNATTKMCRKTLLGPTYGTPIHKVAIIPTADPVNDSRYLAYITDDKIGVHKLPLDGNPHNAMALIAHPQGVVNIVASYDGKYVFTAGGNDATVHMWAINTTALEAQALLGGEQLEPFYGLLDGGREGELFKELEDYFYYAQIRSQGVDTMENRQVTVKIPLREIPFVMRAMGFYPSEQEVEDMLNEIKYSQYVETGQYTTDIDLGDFIKLYINHRPAFGLQPDILVQAFETLGFQAPGGMAIDRGDFLDMLQTKGEHMMEEELAEYLTTLLGCNEEGGSSELHKFDTTDAADIIQDYIPEDITANMFCNELLGFAMYQNPGLYSERPESGVPVERKSTQVTFCS